MFDYGFVVKSYVKTYHYKLVCSSIYNVIYEYQLLVTIYPMSYQMNLILKEYDKKREILENLDKSLETLINSLLKQKGIKAHQIQTRVKDRGSLEKKILAKQKYKSLDDITDIVGIRIITYFEDEVDKVAKVVEEEFDLDQENSVDKRDIDTDRFGYRSLHYVASLKKIELSFQSTQILKLSNLSFKSEVSYNIHGQKLSMT